MCSVLAREIRRRLPERDHKSPSELHAQFWPTLPEDEVRALFDFLETDLGIPAGILRPEDDLDRLFTPISMRRPLRWLRVRPALEHATSRLYSELANRVSARVSTIPVDFRVHTLNDLVYAWCGVVLC